MNDDKEYEVIGTGPEGSEKSGKDRQLGTAEVVFHKPTKAPTEAPTVKPDEMVKQSVSESIHEHCQSIPEPDIQEKVESGKPTTSFSHDIEAVYKGTETIVSGTAGIVSEGVNMTGAVVNQITNNVGMALKLTDSVISGITKLVTLKTTEMVQAVVTYTAKLPVDIMSYYNSYITDFLPQATKEVVTEITGQAGWSAWQEALKEELEEALKKAKEQKTLNTQFKGVEKIQKCLNGVKSKMEKITERLDEGSTFIQNKTMELVDNKFDEISNISNKVVIAIAEQEMRIAREIGERRGVKAVEKQKKKLKKTLQEQMNKVEEAKQKANIVAAQVKAIVISKVAAITGL